MGSVSAVRAAAVCLWERDDRSFGPVLEPLPDRDSRLLVVWNPRYGCWTLPGGRVEEGETPLAAAVRELEEETGARATTVTLAYEAPADPVALEPGRGQYVYVYRVVSAYRTPREVEPGCPVSWFTRDAFFAGCRFHAFYRTMFEVLATPGRRAPQAERSREDGHV